MKPSKITLQDMLDARERRARAQEALLKDAPENACLVSFSLNIAGDVKRTPKTRLLFDRGLQMFEDLQLPELHRSITDAHTGTEALLLVQADAHAVKARTERIEDAFPAARLFDFDVINRSGEKLSRKEPRACLVCGGAAAVCARSRAHGLDAVKTATEELLNDFCADLLGSTARKALEQELYTTPKPGLVDRNNNGAHTDMNLMLFLKSALTLEPYCSMAALLGLKQLRLLADLPDEPISRELLEFMTEDPLVVFGKQAERKMFRATNGVNTHKGMIYSMGLLLYGMGKALTSGGDAIAHAAAFAERDAERRLERAREQQDTNGAKVLAKFGAVGAVGEAVNGFPHAVACADRLAFYTEAGAENPGALALCDTMAVLEDTNLLHRGGIEGLRFVQTEAARIAALPIEAREDALLALDETLIEKNLSPGGSADMLALAYLLDAWRTMTKDVWEVRI